MFLFGIRFKTFTTSFVFLFGFRFQDLHLIKLFIFLFGFRLQTY